MKIGFIGRGRMGAGMASNLDWSAIGGLATQDAGDLQAAMTSPMSSAI
jgi:3-hydroxyisobutyrate dehydrogenase-like beta-hydroxyacid dehydrogenase